MAERIDEIMEGAISIKNVNRVYDDGSSNSTQALKNVNLEVRAGEFISFIGPSGCGKTTLMRLIAGLDKPQSGELFLDGKKIDGTNYERGYVFQQANLFPWETIEKNIAAGLIARNVYKENKEEVSKFIEIAGLKGFEKAYPHQISGGMVQRASLVRGLINVDFKRPRNRNSQEFFKLRGEILEKFNLVSKPKSPEYFI